MTNGPIDRGDGSAGDGDGKRQPLGKAGEQRGSACATGDSLDFWGSRFGRAEYVQRG